MNDKTKDKAPPKKPIFFYPFPAWKGARVGVRCTVESELFFAMMMLPICTNEKDFITNYGVNKVMAGTFVARTVQYRCDDALRAAFNAEMKTQKCDLDGLKDKFKPADKTWFIEPPSDKVSKQKETTNTQAETGWTHEAMIEHMKKHPKKK
jgi:hypothetical protein